MSDLIGFSCKEPPINSIIHIMSSDSSSSSITERACALVGSVIPSCMEGLRLVELGQQRQLKLHERLALFYNTPLCLHCNCKRDKFDKERAKLREIDRQRRASDQ